VIDNFVIVYHRDDSEDDKDLALMPPQSMIKGTKTLEPK